MYSNLFSLKKSVSDGKSALASAITAKGVPTAADATFETMLNNIRNIQTNVTHTIRITGYTSDRSYSGECELYIDGIHVFSWRGSKDSRDCAYTITL